MPKYTIDFAELKANTTIEQVLSMLDVFFKQRGNQFRGSCTVCDSGDRTLVVTPDKEAWYCFGCKKGGDLISLVAHIRDIKIRDAALAIAEELGTVPAPERNDSTNSSRNSSRNTVPQSEEVKETKKTSKPECRI